MVSCFRRNDETNNGTNGGMPACKCATLSSSMLEHASSSLTKQLSLEEEKEVRLYLLEELKSIIKKYALYYASHEEEPTPQQFFAWIEMLGEEGTRPSDESFDEQVLAHDVRRFERLYTELANIALKKPIGKEVQEASGIFSASAENERLRVFDEKALVYLENLVAKGADKKLVAEGLSGLNSDRAWDLRKQILKDGYDIPIIIGIAGLDSDRAWEMRDQLFKKGSHRCYVVQSLAGVDSDRAWRMRERFLRERGDNEAVVKSLASLVGLDSDRAWEMRDQFFEEDRYKDSVIKSLAGLDSYRAWTLRFGAGGMYYQNVAQSLVGLDSDMAWEMRDELFLEDRYKSAVVGGLVGLDSDRAWEMREQRILEEGANSSDVALSLAGLDSERAWKMREQLLLVLGILSGGRSKSYLALSLAGDSTTFVWRLLAKEKYKKK